MNLMGLIAFAFFFFSTAHAANSQPLESRDSIRMSLLSEMPCKVYEISGFETPKRLLGTATCTVDFESSKSTLFSSTHPDVVYVKDPLMKYPAHQRLIVKVVSTDFSQHEAPNRPPLNSGEGRYDSPAAEDEYAAAIPDNAVNVNSYDITKLNSWNAVHRKHRDSVCEPPNSSTIICQSVSEEFSSLTEKDLSFFFYYGGESNDHDGRSTYNFGVEAVWRNGHLQWLRIGKGGGFNHMVIELGDLSNNPAFEQIVKKYLQRSSPTPWATRP